MAMRVDWLIRILQTKVAMYYMCELLSSLRTVAAVAIIQAALEKATVPLASAPEPAPAPAAESDDDVAEEEAACEAFEDVADAAAPPTTSSSPPLPAAQRQQPVKTLGQCEATLDAAHEAVKQSMREAWEKGGAAAGWTAYNTAMGYATGALRAVQHAAIAPGRLVACTGDNSLQRKKPFFEAGAHRNYLHRPQLQSRAYMDAEDSDEEAGAGVCPHTRSC